MKTLLIACLLLLAAAAQAADLPNPDPTDLIISNVALTGNTLSYTIADNSDADADPTVGVVADPVVTGQLATSTGVGYQENGLRHSRP
jgi:hypothetical protein